MPRSRSSSSETASRQGDNGHFEWTVGQVLHEKYTITGFLGDGTFGRVLKVSDLEGTEKAIKVIRAVERYVEAAKIEAEIIEKLNSSDPEHKSHIVKLFEHFPLGDNYCLVFEKLGKSLFDVIKDNQFKGDPHSGFRMTQVQEFAKQLLITLDFMHTLGLTHTDLKPENILLVHPEMKWDEEKVGDC
jgi:serine/threonine protein kinase